jgi:uncharacterized protein YneF (UPF0154 family)
MSDVLFMIVWVLSGIVGGVCVLQNMTKDRAKLDTMDIGMFFIVILYGPIGFLVGAGIAIFTWAKGMKHRLPKWTFGGIDNPFYRR